MTDQSVPGVIAPPPLIYLAGLIVGLAVDRLWPVINFAGTGWTVAGIGLAVLGLGIALAGAFRFRLARTPVEPWKPSSALVVAGIYRVTRNPMYVGMTLVYVAIAFLFGGVVTLALLAPVLATIRWGVIAREERYLEARFGADYLDYKAQVRRWL